MLQIKQKRTLQWCAVSKQVNSGHFFNLKNKRFAVFFGTKLQIYVNTQMILVKMEILLNIHF